MPDGLKETTRSSYWVVFVMTMMGEGYERDDAS